MAVRNYLIAAVAAVGLFAVIHLMNSPHDASPTPPPGHSKPSMTQEIPPVEPKGGVVWAPDYDSAVSQARAQDKPLMVDLHASWCTWCKVLDKKVFPNSRVGAAAASFVCVRLDTEQDDGQGFADRYHVTTLPTIIFIDPDGSLVGRIAGYQEPEEFRGTLESLSRDRADYRALTTKMKLHRAGIDDEVRLADINVHRGNEQEARVLIELVRHQGANRKLGHIYAEAGDEAWFTHDHDGAKAQYAQVLAVSTTPTDLFDARRHLFLFDIDAHDYAAAESELHAVLAMPGVSETTKQKVRKSLIALEKLKARAKVARG